jgi:hypothetical protein
MIFFPKFESEPDPFWITEFIETNVQPIITTLALSYDFDEDRSKAIQKTKKREEKKRQCNEESPDIAAIAIVEPSAKRGKSKLVLAKRVAWSIGETRALCQGVINFSGPKWAEISTAPELKHRNNVHCKDRMRVLLKQYGSNDLVEVAERWMNDFSQTDE